MTDRHPMNQLPVQAAFTLGTLAALTGLIVAKADILQNFKALTLHGVWGLTSLTAGDGPLLFGIASAEWSLAEIEQYLEVIVRDQRDATNNEQAARSVQVLGALGLRLETVYQREKVILPTFREGQGWNMWVYNRGIAMTTGALVKMSGRFFGRWLD